MLNLVKLAASAIIALASQVHPGKVPSPEEKHRLEMMGSDIGFAVEMQSKSPFDGPMKKEAATLAMVAIAYHESGFQERVATCKKTGDNGSSLSIFQLNGRWAWNGGTWIGTREESKILRQLICSNQSYAAYSALMVLNRRSCEGQNYEHIFRAYASGSCGNHNDKRNISIHAGRVRCDTWNKLLKKSNLTGSCYSRAPIKKIVEETEDMRVVSM